MKLIKKKYSIIIFLVIIYICLVGADGGSGEIKIDGKSIPKIVASVNGINLDSEFIINQIKVWKVTKLGQGLPVSNQDEKKYALYVLNKAIDQELIFQAGKAKKIIVSKEIIQKEIKNIKRKFPDHKTFIAALAFQNLTIDRLTKKIEKQLTEESYLRIEIAPIVDVPDERVREFYEKNKSQYKSPVMYDVSQIYISSLNSSSEAIEDELERQKAERLIQILEAETKELMAEIMKKLKQGNDFALIAKENSEDEETRDKGGNMGEISLGQILPELASVIAELKSGEFSNVVKTSYGSHIIKLNKINTSRQITFEEIETDILNGLLKAEVQKKRSELLTELRKSAEIKTFL